MADLLVVDDDADIAEVLAEILRMEGHDVRVARNGMEGLKEVYERKPDVVLLDVEMPQLTGPDMAYYLFIYDMGYERVPIVLLSGVLELPEIARLVGTPYFLGKPYVIGDVLALVTLALRERTAPVPGRPRAGEDDRPGQL